jgi:hypothetical protein
VHRGHALLNDPGRVGFVQPHEPFCCGWCPGGWKGRRP